MVEIAPAFKLKGPPTSVMAIPAFGPEVIAWLGVKEIVRTTARFASGKFIVNASPAKVAHCTNCVRIDIKAIMKRIVGIVTSLTVVSLV